MNDQQALIEIQCALDGEEWTPATLERIARIMVAAGYRIRDLDDVDREDLEPEAPKPAPLAPETVYVHWSESPVFEERQTYAFSDFERLALRAAVYKGAGGGYDKTKITVRFTDGTTYDCRLDLAEDDDKGFQHYVERTLHWLRQRHPEGSEGADYLARIRFFPE